MPPRSAAAAEAGLRAAYSDIATFSRLVWPARVLRRYQLAPAHAIVESVRRGDGGTYCVVFSRQAGKDELVAQLQAYLLHLFRLAGGSSVLVAPTLRPQAMISRDRLIERLRAAHALAPFRARERRQVEVGRAGATFLSAGPTSHARGATASRLLICNEAQDVRPERWDAIFAPMTASTNAVSLFLGTPWTSTTLLARQMAYCRELERRDGRRRVFQVAWPEVAAELPIYAEHVRGRIAQLGPTHPFIRTEYCLEELDDGGSLFPAARQAQLHGSHPRRRRALPGRQYALLVDVAGEEEPAQEEPEPRLSRRRDATALTVVEVDLRASLVPGIEQPTYRIVDRRLWVGTKHATLYATLLDLARSVWRARWIVVDATGVGAGLASFLRQALGPRLIPVVFSAARKSEIGWHFLAAIDAGRVKDYADDGAVETALFWRQLAACTYTVLPGPDRRLRWSVPSATLHDDLLVSAALIGWLDLAVDWRSRIAVGRSGSALQA